METAVLHLVPAARRLLRAQHVRRRRRRELPQVSREPRTRGGQKDFDAAMFCTTAVVDTVHGRCSQEHEEKARRAAEHAKKLERRRKRKNVHVQHFHRSQRYQVVVIRNVVHKIISYFLIAGSA